MFSRAFRRSIRVTGEVLRSIPHIYRSDREVLRSIPQIYRSDREVHRTVPQTVPNVLQVIPNVRKGFANQFLAYFEGFIPLDATLFWRNYLILS